MGKSQIKTNIKISNLSSEVFKPFSEISDPKFTFFLKSQLFQAKSQTKSQNLSWK